MVEEIEATESQTQQTPPEQPPEQASDQKTEQATAQEAPAEPEQWAQLLPELAGQYQQLSPEARERVLFQRLARIESAQVASTGDRPTKESPTDTEDEGELPPPQPAPTLDMEALAKEVNRGLEESNPQAVVGAFKQVTQYAQGVMQRAEQVARITYRAMKEQEADLKEMYIPFMLQNSLSQVRGANREDLPEARKILESGEATTPQAALGLAVFRRANATPGKPAPTDEAKRKAQSLSAARAGVEDIGATGTNFRIPETTEETLAFMEAEERAKSGKK